VGQKAWIFLFLFLIFLFFWRFLNLPKANFSPGQRIKIEATLRQEPKITGNLQKFSLAGIEITTFRFPEFHYGERLEVEGVVEKKNFLEFPEIRKIGEEKTILGLVYRLRRKIEGIYRQSLPEPYSSLLSGIVLGIKSEMPSSFYNSLQKTGTLHVVVASGMNVSILAGTLVSFLILFLRRQIAVFLSFILIWFYVFLAGAEIPILRAGIMGSLAFLAQGLGREEDAWRAFGLSALFLLFLNPLSIFDLGFQLSFGATFGILFFGSFFSRLFSRLPNQIRSDFSQTLAAQITTLPIILLNFGYYSPFSPLVNVLIAWVLPWIMRLGMVIASFGLIFFFLGRIFAFLTFPFLAYFVFIIKLFSGL